MQTRRAGERRQTKQNNKIPHTKEERGQQQQQEQDVINTYQANISGGIEMEAKPYNRVTKEIETRH